MCRQVLPGWYLPNEIAIILDVDNSPPEDYYDEPAAAAAVQDIDEDDFEEDEYADWYEADGAAGRRKMANKTSKKGARPGK